jgi:cold shock CspA family protein
VPTGVVKWCNGRWGFISRDDGKGDIFVHVDNLMDGRTTLHGGQKVVFDIGSNKKGLVAINVWVVSPECGENVSKALCRHEAIRDRERSTVITFSGAVDEYFHGQGYGFIRAAGKSVFFRASARADKSWRPVPGDPIECKVVKVNGQYRATEVRCLEKKNRTLY